MPNHTEDDTRERRWIPVYCYSCQADHGVTVGGLLAIVRASQQGDLITTGGSSLCLSNAVQPDTRIGTYRVDFNATFKG